MRVFGRALILWFAVTLCVPAGASAAPFLLDSTGQANLGGLCSDALSGIGAAECSLFPVLDLSAPLSFSGEFATFSDMALFSFALDGATRLQIETTSFGFDRLPDQQSFDPTLALYRADGSILTVLDPAGSGQQITANQFDINLDLGNWDDRVDVVLGSGNYLLALVTGFAYESLLNPFDGGDLGRGSAFNFTFNATPEVEGPAPVPEPGTLTLLAGGALAGLIQRRRSKKRNRTEPVSR